MNPDTGHLIALRRGEGLPEGYETLPEELFKDAERKLARMATRGIGETDFAAEAQVNTRSRTPLAQWAKKKRLAKLAAKSRRVNRK